MRWAFAMVLLAGCVGWQPLQPEWRRDEEVDARSASAAVAAARAPVSPWQTIGTSLLGRPLRMRRIGHGPRRVIWIGGIHGNEREGSVSTERLPAALVEFAGAADRVTLTILEDANPDGSALGRRWNAKGVDLNRNYPATNFLPGARFGRYPLDQPEAKAVHDLIVSERPHLVIVAHSWGGDHFINFDGPAVRHAELFSRRSGYRVKPSDRIAPTPGSLGSWVGRKLQIPILTLEHERGTDPAQNWFVTREALLAVILSA